MILLVFIGILVFITGLLQTSINASDDLLDNNQYANRVLREKTYYTFSLYFLLFVLVGGFYTYYTFFPFLQGLLIDGELLVLMIFTLCYVVSGIFSYPRLINFTSRIIIVIGYVFFIFSKPLSLLVTLIKKIIRSDVKHKMDKEQIKDFIEEAAENDTLGSEEIEMVTNLIDLADVNISSIYTPRKNVIGVHATNTTSEILNVFRESGFSRLPVYKEDLDEIVGTINYKDFINEVYLNKKPLSFIIDTPIYITEHKKTIELLRDFRLSKNHIAIVLDDFGGTLGIVTLEDLLEEIVGEIQDEHDEEEEDIEKLTENEIIADGDASFSDVFEFFKKEDEIENYDADFQTISGLITKLLGDFPKKGDKVSFHGLSFEVLGVDKFIVSKVKIKKVSDETR